MLELERLIFQERQFLDDAGRGEFDDLTAKRWRKLLNQMLLLDQRIEIFTVILKESLDAHSCLGREADLE